MNEINNFKQFHNKFDTCHTATNIYQALQIKVHCTVSSLQQLIEVPEVILSISRLSFQILSSHPTIKPILEKPLQLTKEIKNFTNLIKGLKSIDGFLHFKSSWRFIVLNVSSFSLLVISTLTITERYSFLDVSAIKTNLAALPYIGVLPFGGILSLASSGLYSSLLLNAIDKRNQIINTIDHIKTEKIALWTEPLSIKIIEMQQMKYATKIETLEREIDGYQAVIDKGKRVLEAITKQPLQNQKPEKLNSCERALTKLSHIIEKKRSEIATCQEKQESWHQLAEHFDIIDPQEIQAFQEAKLDKWKTKLDKLNLEKKVSFFTIVINIIRISKQIVIVGAILTGYGTVLVPIIVVGCDLSGSSLGLKNFFDKKSIRKIRIEPVNFDHYIKSFEIE